MTQTEAINNLIAQYEIQLKQAKDNLDNAPLYNNIEQLLLKRDILRIEGFILDLKKQLVYTKRESEKNS